MADEDLQSLLARKAAHDQAVEQKKSDAAKAAADKSDRDRQAKNRWLASVGQLQSVIEQLNPSLETQKMKLLLEGGKREADLLERGFLHQTIVVLFVEGAADCQLVFNIRAPGKVAPNFLIPHTGRNPDDVAVFDVDEGYFRKIILLFIDQVISHMELKLKGNTITRPVRS